MSHLLKQANTVVWWTDERVARQTDRQKEKGFLPFYLFMQVTQKFRSDQKQ